MKRPQAAILIQERDAVGTIPSTDELSRVDYCGNMVYDRGERRMLLENGYVTFDITTNTPSYHFYLRDHLGNNRVVMAGDGTVEQVTHYYPFGGVMRESTNPGLQPYKYGGKELDRTSGLDAYDFGARMFFADRMQWGQMDPLCEKYYDVSPYNYCVNKPVNAFDSDGRDWYELGGEVFWNVDVSSQSNTPEGGTYLGKRYNGLSIDKYEITVFNENKDSLKTGICIILNYEPSDGSSTDQMRWVQNYKCTYDDGYIKQYKDPEDGKGIFYFTESEEKQYNTGVKYLFYDAPYRSKNNPFIWEGELSLVSTGSKGNVIISTLKYGFKSTYVKGQQGETTLLPQIRIIEPSVFQKVLVYGHK